MFRRLFMTCVFSLVLGLLGCDGRRLPINDFNEGFNEGIVMVREARSKGGILGEAGARMVPAFPDRTGESAQWNAGFRAGIAASRDDGDRDKADRQQGAGGAV